MQIFNPGDELIGISRDISLLNELYTMPNKSHFLPSGSSLVESSQRYFLRNQQESLCAWEKTAEMELKTVKEVG